jgi:hypothetical protein
MMIGHVRARDQLDADESWVLEKSLAYRIAFDRHAACEVVLDENSTWREEFDREAERPRARASVKEDQVKRTATGEHILPAGVQHLRVSDAEETPRDRKPLWVWLDSDERGSRSEGSGNRLRPFAERRADLGNLPRWLRGREYRKQRPDFGN